MTFENEQNYDFSDRYHTVMLACGYVETADMSTLICSHEEGFKSLTETLLSLHKTLYAAFKAACDDINYKPLKEENMIYPGQDLEFWIPEFIHSTNDTFPGDHDAVFVFDDYGWTIPSLYNHIRPGFVINVLEHSEYILCSEENVVKYIENYKQCKHEHFRINLLLMNQHYSPNNLPKHMW
jgi:hypothetical protein